MQRTVEDHDLVSASGEVLTFVNAQLGRRLREYYPQVVAIEPDSPLGRILDRLTEALRAPGGDGLPAAFKDDLIGMVPRLRRYAMSLTHDAVEADDLVQLTLLKAWESRHRFEMGSNLVVWLFTILRNGHINGRRKY